MLVDDTEPANQRLTPSTAASRAGHRAASGDVRLTVRQSARRYLHSLSSEHCVVLLWGVDNDTANPGWTAITLPARHLHKRLPAAAVIRLEDVVLVIPDGDRARIGELNGRALEYCRGALILE